MANSSFIPVAGRIIRVNPMLDQCCNLMVSLETNNGITNLIVSPNTYVIDNTELRSNLMVTGFYDSSLPVPLIFPPQYQAFVIGRRRGQETIAYHYFDQDLVASDNSLKLNISQNTEIRTFNGQRFGCDLANRWLIVYYTASTRSIPAQTTPSRVIVTC